MKNMDISNYLNNFYQTFKLNQVELRTVGSDKKIKYPFTYKITIFRDKGDWIVKTKNNDNFSMDFMINVYQELFDIEYTFHAEDIIGKRIVISGYDIENCVGVEIDAEFINHYLEKIISVKFKDHLSKETELAKRRVYYLYKETQYLKLSEGISSKLIIDSNISIVLTNIKVTNSNLNILYIEYSTLDNEKDVALLLSFLFGCPIIQCGFCKFSDSNELTEIGIDNSRYDYLQILDYPVLPPYHIENSSIFVDLFGNLFLKYNQLSANRYNDLLGLLSRLWDSRKLFLDYKIVLLIDGLEIFMKNTIGFENNNNFKYIDNNLWDEISSEGWEMLQELFSKNGISTDAGAENRIKDNDLNTIKGRFMELNIKKDNIQILFEKMRIPLSSEEIDAIVFRHQVTHQLSLLDDTDEAVKKSLHKYLTAVSLCYHTISHIYGFNCEYLIDYSKFK